MGLLTPLEDRLVYLDTNVFVYALNAFPPFVKPLIDLLQGIDERRVHAVTSELTMMELLVVPFRNHDAQAEARCRMILRPRPCLHLAEVSLEVLETAARLRAENTSLPTPDAIHLATATLAGSQVLLTNDRHFMGPHDVEVLLLSEWVDAVREE